MCGTKEECRLELNIVENIYSQVHMYDKQEQILNSDQNDNSEWPE